jgi:hypothetical protein
MSFKSDIEKFARKVNTDSEKVFRGTSIAMFSSIVKRTPVDTGRLRANWQLDINRDPQEQLDKADKGGGSTITDGATTANRATTKDSIFIVNNLPYAQAIEDGASTVKSPEGMVKVTLQEFQGAVKKEANKVSK